MTKEELAEYLEWFIQDECCKSSYSRLIGMFNNPGLLRWWPETKISTSELGEQFAHFSTYKLGEKALRLQIKHALMRGLTIIDLLDKTWLSNKVKSPFDPETPLKEYYG